MTSFLTSHRHTPHPNGFRAAVKLGDDYASRARSAIDIDEPSLDNLQAIVLLAIAYTASGKGRKAFMLISTYTCPLPVKLPSGISDLEYSQRYRHDHGTRATS